VLVIDDEPQIARALRRALEADGVEVTAAASGQEALSLAATHLPELAIVDLGLPDLGGIDVIRELRSWGEMRVIVLSGSDGETTEVEAFAAGADDYVTKPFGLDEFRARVQAVLRRSHPDASPAALVFGDLEVDLVRQAVSLRGGPVRLTKTEQALLEAMVDNPGKLLTHWWLLDKVWGRGVSADGRQSLRVYVRQLRAKLGDDAECPTYILTEPGVGYRWIATSRSAG